MNRRLRNLLTGSLLGAVASVVMNLGRRRLLGRGRKVFPKAGRPLRMALGQIGRLAFAQKWLPFRRRVR